MGTLHPALVHIPVGLLIVYSGIEIGLLFFKSYRERLSLGKYLMLLIGVVGGFFALQTGEALEDVWGYSALIELHATFATTTFWLYAVILLMFTIDYARASSKVVAYVQKTAFVQPLWKALVGLSAFTLKQPILALLALLGGVTLTITGALGGALAHGPEADPAVSFIYSLFF
jgi:uncharacterized membrane protein